MLARAGRAVAVTLSSDTETRVTLLKVARLGEFAEKELELRPGEYTAVGVRRGYRDVRKTFTVDPDAPPQTIHIACTEPI